MPSQLKLWISAGSSQEKCFDVAPGSFSVGRAEGNDLVIDDAGASRRHALITWFNDQAQLTDCGSANGIALNGKNISGSATLRDGDVFTLGNECRIRVSIERTATAAKAVAAKAVPTKPSEPKPPEPAGDKTVNLSSPVLIAGAAVALIVLITVISVVLVAGRKKTTPMTPPPPQLEQPIAISPDIPPIAAAPTDSTEGYQLEKLAVQVIRNISNDQSYPFTPAILAELKREVDQYESLPVAGAVKAFEAQGADIINAARNQGIKPELIIYLALANTNAGKSGNPIEIARSMIPQINFLRAHFGTNFADQTLLTVAATKVPGGTAKSHPLVACASRKAAGNPQADRNVWFLHEHGCINDEAYQFVLKFLAFGVLAQKASK